MDEVLLYRRQARAKYSIEAAEHVFVHLDLLDYDSPVGPSLPFTFSTTPGSMPTSVP